MITRILPILLVASVSAGTSDVAQMLGEPHPDRYEFADGAVLLVNRDATHDTLKASNGEVVADLRENEVVADAVQSPNKRFLLCLLRTHRGSVQTNGSSRSLGMDFSGLARISHSPSGWTFGRVWKVDQVESVQELGAISDDGARALFKIGGKSAPVSPYRVAYYWQTWDLDKNVLIKTGLKVE